MLRDVRETTRAARRKLEGFGDAGLDVELLPRRGAHLLGRPACDLPTRRAEDGGVGSRDESDLRYCSREGRSGTEEDQQSRRSPRCMVRVKFLESKFPVEALGASRTSRRASCIASLWRP